VIRVRSFAVAWLVSLLATPSVLVAQNRIAVLTAEDHRAATAHDLSIIKGGLHGRDPQTVRVAVRAIGRLERPSLAADIVPLLRHPLPEIRAEAANALAQAAQGLKRQSPARVNPVRPASSHKDFASPLDAIVDALASRLRVEEDPTVLGTISASIGRLPYTTAAQLEGAETLLLDARSRDESADARLGVAQGFEALSRVSNKISPLSTEAVAALTAMATLQPRESAGAARIRRLSLEALTNAGAADDATIQRATTDPDFQVRRLAMKAAGTGELDASARSALFVGLRDAVGSVRYEALRGLGARADDGGCAVSRDAIADVDVHVALLAIDSLSQCSWSAAAVSTLDGAVRDLGSAGSSRGWHRAAHGLTALASAAPDHAARLLPQFMASRVWQLRMYAARAAATMKNRAALQQLSMDDDDNVREAALEGLSKTAGHDADDTFIAQLGRNDNQLIRTAAIALKGSSRADAVVPALQAALDRLRASGRDNARDAEAAIIDTLQGFGASVQPLKPVDELPATVDLDAEAINRLQGARAHVTIRGVGAFDLALIATEAPATVVRFAKLAESGYYNGLTFHRVVPNFVIQGGSPGANEYVGDATYMLDEVGLWPHVRGAAGISTRGRDTGDAQIFIDLVDNPRLDHEYTVFAQVLNGIDVVDQILEGDVIDSITIVR